jgi:hypothetical protein
MSNPFDAPELEDQLVLFGPTGKATIPGVARVSVNTQIREDVAEVEGEDGAQVTTLGYDPAEIKVEVQLWEASQYDKLKAILELYRPRRNHKPQPVDAVHPKLLLHGIRQVYLFKIQDEPYTSKEGYRLTLSLREWWSETKKKATATNPLSSAAASEFTIESLAPDRPSDDTPLPTSLQGGA